MQEDNVQALKDELEMFRKEKEKIRLLVGQVGGKTEAKRDRFFTILSIILLGALFLVDILRHALQVHIPLPPLFSIELGILLVSVKIIWMMHRQSKIEHFQFWILNSIEFRLNDLAKQVRHIRGQTDTLVSEEPDEAD